MRHYLREMKCTKPDSSVTEDFLDNKSVYLRNLNNQYDDITLITTHYAVVTHSLQVVCPHLPYSGHQVSISENH